MREVVIKRGLLGLIVFILFMLFAFLLLLNLIKLRVIGNIEKISMDADGSIFIMAEAASSYDFIKLDKNGNTEFILSYPKRDLIRNISYGYPNIIIVDGVSYIHQEVYDDDKRIINESIMQISKDGAKDIFTLNSRDENTFIYSKFFSVDDKLYFLQKSEDGIKALSFEGNVLVEVVPGDTKYNEIILIAAANQEVFYNGEDMLAFIDLCNNNLVISNIDGVEKLKFAVLIELSGELAFCGESMAFICKDSRGIWNQILYCPSLENINNTVSITPTFSLDSYWNRTQFFMMLAALVYALVRTCVYLIVLVRKRSPKNLSNEAKLTFMHANIRGFSVMEADMTNNEKTRILKEINQNGGFVQNHDNTDVTGLFRGDPENSLITALKIQERIKAYNQSRLESGESQIKVGIILNHVNVISEEASVISKHVPMLKKLERIAGELGMGILATGWLLDEIKDKEKYWCRYLGKIISAEFGEPIDIYEFYEHDEKKHVKKYTADRFETGVRLFYASEYYEARKHFNDVLTLLQEDMASKIYLEKCSLCIGGQKEVLGLAELK